MKILAVNTLDSRGGAAKFAERLGLSLAARDHDARMLVGFPSGSTEKVDKLRYPGWSRRLNRRLRLRGMLLPTAHAVGGHPWFQVADILHIHNLHAEPFGYFNIRNLPALSRAKPTVWTLHDPWIVFEDGRTPEYDQHFRRLPRIVSGLKRRAIELSEVTFVAPSSWLAQLVAESFPHKRMEIVPHGVDTRIFRPIDKAEARAALGISTDRKVVLFVANEGESNVPKGGAFVRAVRSAPEVADVLFTSLGASHRDEYVSSEPAMAAHYAAADALLLPSAAENFPLVALESMACGTPVVAFRVGGLPEIVTHLRDGYLAEYGDSDDLLAGLTLVLSDPAAAQFGKVAARRVCEDFSSERMTDAYLRLYSMLTRR